MATSLSDLPYAPAEAEDTSSVTLEAILASGAQVHFKGTREEQARFMTAVTKDQDKEAGAGKGVSTKSSSTSSIDFSNLASQISADVQEARNAADRAELERQVHQANYNAAVAARIDAVGGKGTAQAAAKNAEGIMYAEQATGAVATIDRLGVNDSSAEAIGARLAVRIRQQEEQRFEMRDAITQKANAIPDLLSDPIAWLVGRYQLSGDVSQHNNLLAQINADKAALDRITGAATELQTVNLAKTGYGKAAIALAQGIEATENARETQARFQEEAARTNSAYAEQALQNKLHIANLRMSEVRLLEMSELAEDRKLAKDKKIEADAALLEGYQETSKMLGWPPLPSLEGYKRMNEQQKKAFQVVQSSGGENFGETTVQAMRTIGSGNTNLMSLDTKAMLAYTRQAYEEAEKRLTTSTATSAEFKTAKAEDKDRLRSAQMYEIFKEWQHDSSKKPVPFLDGNPYRAPSYNQMQTDPIFSKTELSRLLADTKKAVPSLEMTDSQVLQIVKEELVTGSRYGGSLEKATADLQTYFQQAMLINNGSMNFDKWHLPKQTEYMLGGKNYAERKTITIDLAKSLAAKYLPQSVANTAVGLTEALLPKAVFSRLLPE